jgi:hypothetical protein
MDCEAIDGAHDKIEFEADVCMLKPIDMTRGNGRLLYEVNNRGNKHAIRFFNDASLRKDGSHDNGLEFADSAGNGFLMREGYSVVWSGWQGDLLPGNDRMTIALPKLRGNLCGLVRSEIIVEDDNVKCMPLSGNNFTRCYPVANLDDPKATVTVREHGRSERIKLPRSSWSFAQVGVDGKPVPSNQHICIADGFRPGWLYEVVYTAQEPLPLGLGFIGVRELLDFLAHGERDAAGHVNPLADRGKHIDKVYAFGTSQCARFLREFVYRGLNQGKRGGGVINGLIAHVAGAGRVTLNYRFAQPGRHPRQHQDQLYPSDEFPFAYPVSEDHITGKVDGILKRPDSDPFVIHTQGAAEYWERRGSLVHTDTRGRRLPDHERARVYLFSSAPHDPAPYDEHSRSTLRYPRSTLRSTALLRALLVALDDWATNGVVPPESKVPEIETGTGGFAEDALANFPALPHVELPTEPNRAFLIDFGEQFDARIFAMEPPAEDLSKEYPLVLARTDSDGLEIAGIRTPDVEVPIATYTGWNLRTNGRGAHDQAGIMGSEFPFALSDKERSASDPRASLEQRYASREEYIRLVTRAANQLVTERLLLQEDANRYIEIASSASDFRASGSG